MKHSKYSSKRRLLLIVCFSVLAVALICAIAGTVYAKFFQQSGQSMVVKAKQFYFKSNLLTEKGATYQLNPDTTQIEIELYNYADEYRVSDVTIKCQYKINGETKSDSFELKKNQEDKKVITLDVEPGNTYEIEVVGSAGYQKTLSATFEVLEYAEGFYQYIDISDPYFIQLTIWADKVPGNNPGEVSITFPEELIPDTTNPELAAISAGSNIFTTSLGSNNSKTYRFFKESSTSDVDINNFIVTINGTKATNRTPN